MTLASEIQTFWPAFTATPSSPICSRVTLTKYQHCYLVGTFARNTFSGFASGYIKFKFSISETSQNLTYNVIPEIGTTQADAEATFIKFMQNYWNPKPDHAQTAYGFSVRKAKNGQISKKGIANFTAAEKSKFFHPRFVTLCKKNGLTCFSRPPLADKKRKKTVAKKKTAAASKLSVASTKTSP